ncbi:MAG: septum formation protein Maf [Gemmatimonadetes bacterium]|nr:septum formation protein Maf [Gemmatimonadota bacterium]
MTRPRLVLASASPRRSELLSRLGLEHTVDPAHVDETALPEEAPRPHVVRLSEAKARAVARRHPDALVFAGDTVVVDRRRILGKPSSEDEAVAMLMALSGRTHAVVSGLALALPETAGGRVFSRADRTDVTFQPFDESVARAYVATGEPMDKAGAYGIQGLGGALVKAVDGDYTTVVGLSISGLVELLRQAGWRYRFGALVPRETPTDPE